MKKYWSIVAVKGDETREFTIPAENIEHALKAANDDLAVHDESDFEIIEVFLDEELEEEDDGE